MPANGYIAAMSDRMKNESTHDVAKKREDAEVLPPDSVDRAAPTEAPSPHSVPANEGGESD